MRSRRLRRGISPIIATILLIVIAVAASFLVWNYISIAGRPRTVVKLDVVTVDAAIPPDGSEATISFTFKNSGTYRVTIDNVTVEYAGKSKVYTIGRDLAPGATMQWVFTSKASDLGTGIKFVDGDTIKLIINYKDTLGNTYTVTKYATLHLA